MFIRLSMPLLAFIIAGYCSAGAASLPTLEPKVFDFITHAKQGERLSVLVLYHSPEPSGKSLNRAQFATSLRTRLNKMQSQVFKRLSLRAMSSVEPYWLAQASKVSLTKEELARLALDKRIRRLIWADRPIFLSQPILGPGLSFQPNAFTYGLSHIRVPEARAQFPIIDGSGVRVGIIDTGISVWHPDLRGKLLDFKNFTSTLSTEPHDDHGHGTHVAGTIAGGSSSGQSIGVAPGAKLLVAKAFGSYGGTETAWLLSSMQWLADPDGNPNTADHAQVINASWNNDEDMSQITPLDSPFCVAISNLTQLGIVTVGSAGNEGPGTRTVRIPGTCPGAVSIASTDDHDEASGFSSRGLAVWKNITLQKPDVSAPGSDIYSSSHDGGFKYMSGTSMAAPHAVGAVALILQKQPDLEPAQVVTVLQGSARDLGPAGFDVSYGQGLIDVEKALRSMQTSSKN